MDARRDALKWNTSTPTAGVAKQLGEFQSFETRNRFDEVTMSITIRPMEVRTFLAKFDT
jgi:hypothetical protein